MKRAMTLLGVSAFVLVVYLASQQSTRQVDISDSAPGHSDEGEQSDANSEAMNTHALQAGGETLAVRDGGRTNPSYYLKPRPIEAVHLGFRPEPGSLPLALPPTSQKKRYPGELEARTPEEAAWLDRHGYPTQEELDALDAMTELELAERAARGDLAAMALLGEKQLRQGKIVEGQSNLNESAMLGSIWAILALADSQKARGNTIGAIELYQLAALRGDWLSPSLHMQTGLRKEIKTAELLFTPGNVATLFANMQRLRALRGLPPLGVETRPNPFNRPGGDDPVGVYPRSRANAN
ncbi:MAG TPA: hypothetical protein PLB00_04430 [Pseudomonadota bacterium]|nr:hypothetical protein [Pseudomonadota bacterium]